MNDVDIKFFQATATAIPALAIAFAVSGKYLVKETYSAWPKGGEKFITGVLWLVGFIFCGVAIRAERISLIAIAYNEPTHQHWYTVISSMGMMAVMLVAFVLAPASLPVWETVKAGWAKSKIAGFSIITIFFIEIAICLVWLAFFA